MNPTKVQRDPVITAAPSDVEHDRALQFVRDGRTVATVHVIQDTVPVSFSWSTRYLWHNVRSSIPLLLADAAAALVSLAIGTAVASRYGLTGTYHWLQIAPFAVLGLVFAFLLGKLYPGVGLTRRVETYRCMLLVSLVASVLLTTAWVRGVSPTELVLLAVTWLTGLCLLPLTRLITRRVVCELPWWPQPVIVLGDPSDVRARDIVAKLTKSPWLGLVPRVENEYPRQPWFARRNHQLSSTLDTRDVYRAIVVLSEDQSPSTEQLLEYVTHRFPYVFVVPASCPKQIPLAWNATWTVSGEFGYEIRNRLISPVAQLAKRLIDFIVAATALLLLSPLLVVTAIALKLLAPGPVFYGQERIGRNGVTFKTWKFRTMFVDAEKRLYEYLAHDPKLIAQWELQRKLTNDPRVIPHIGNLLRSTSIDELPQLWNVLKGEMSLVGPRPLPEYHLAHFDDAFRSYRQLVLPGITGLWQVTSRLDSHDEDYVCWDSHYIRNWSLASDALILLRTLRAVYLGGKEESQ